MLVQEVETKAAEYLKKYPKFMIFGQGCQGA